MRGASCVAVAVLAVAAAAAPAAQVVLQDGGIPGGFEQQPVLGAAKTRSLRGKFLHITDFHPDRFFRLHSDTSEDAACHRGQGPAGVYGAETSDCDSPVALINRTMEWIADNLKDEIDFVVWTGDSARHDNDDDHPRSVEQVTELNQFMVNKMSETFGKHNGDEDDDDPNNDFVIPVVPNIGNNDVLPHNIMQAGPSQWTRRYSSMWRQFIPEAQKHQFEQGGWFYVEVIPRKLAVFSLNTMYFFTNNAAVDGCAAHSEPGYRQMEWLRIQLQFMRDRGMKAILIGHVPPARTDEKQLWDETCWQKYALWLQQYRDVVVSGIYGHMNYDHFFLQDFGDILKDTAKGKMPLSLDTTIGASDDQYTALSAVDYLVGLRQLWSKLPDPPKGFNTIMQTAVEELRSIGDDQPPHWTVDDIVELVKSGKGKDKKETKRERQRKEYLEKIGGKYAESFAASFVSASVVPNFFPAIRVFEYNITDIKESVAADSMLVTVPSEHTVVGLYDELEAEATAADFELEKKKKKKKKKKKPKMYKFRVPDGPSESAPPGPAYSPQPLSLTKITQYYANITHINNDFTSSDFSGIGNVSDIDGQKWKSGKHHGKEPHDKDDTPHPKKFKFEVLYDTKDDGVYSLKDLTMPNVVDLARRIGNFKATSKTDLDVQNEGEDDREVHSVDNGLEADKKKKKHKKKKHKKHGAHNKRNLAWYTFIRRAYVHTLDPEELDDEFGQ